LIKDQGIRLDPFDKGGPLAPGVLGVPLSDRCVCEVERCANCNGAHTADSNACPFFLARFNPARMKELLDQKRKDRKENAPVTDSWTTVSKGKHPARHTARMDVDASTSAQ
jgi:hypothetical protein